MTDGGTNNPLSLTKVGTGTQVLSGFNTYTGNTVASAGTLEIADDAAITFRITNTTSNTLTGAGTVLLNGNFAINVAAFNLTTPTSWVLENADSLPGAYGASFQVVTPLGVAWEDAGSDTWILEQGNYKWTFVETTGTLSVVLSGYGQWALTNATGQAASLDHDNDGMTNALEYFMGQSGNSFTSNPVLGAANVITWPKGTGYIGTYSEDYWIETSENLVDWTPVAAAAVTFNSNDIQYTLPSGSPVKFTRLKVVVP
jgi:autotransporter-associated beta strand protein